MNTPTTPNVDWNKLSTEAAVDTLLHTVTAEADELQKQLDRYHECARAGWRRKAELKYGLKVGCIVRDRKGRLYKVTTTNEHPDTPWVFGNPKRKDGKWSAKVLPLYGDWEVVKDA